MADSLVGWLGGSLDVEMLNGAGPFAFAEQQVRDAIVQRVSSALNDQIASFGTLINNLLDQANAFLPTVPVVVRRSCNPCSPSERAAYQRGCLCAMDRSI